MILFPSSVVRLRSSVVRPRSPVPVLPRNPLRFLGAPRGARYFPEASMDKVVLAYSGGLDTSVAIRWIAERYNMEVVTVTANLGNQPDLEAIQEKALRTGAVRAYVHDA